MHIGFSLFDSIKNLTICKQQSLQRFNADFNCSVEKYQFKLLSNLHSYTKMKYLTNFMFSGIGKQVFHELEGVHGLRSQLPARPETSKMFSPANIAAKCKN